MTGSRQYDALASVYEFLVPEPFLEPAGRYGAFGEWVDDLAEGAAVLDCACGPGHLAVGLAQAGFAVTATDASAAMTEKTRALASAHGVGVTVETATWDELDGRGWAGRYEAVFCVGNSLTHAQGTAGRRRALRTMASLLGGGGRLIVTSRNWELVRATGSRLEVMDRIIMRSGRRGLVVHSWHLADEWNERQHADVAVALLDDDGGVRPVVDRLEFWPFRHHELIADLGSVGLRVRVSTYAEGIDRYLVTATRDL